MILFLKETLKPTPVMQQTPAQPTTVPSAKPTIATAAINDKPFLTVKPDYKPNTQTAPKLVFLLLIGNTIKSFVPLNIFIFPFFQ